MITEEIINSFIEKIPPPPEVLKKTIMFLDAGELTKASKVAVEDLALSSYLRDMVNKPIYGFRNNLSDISQIFGILGVSGSQQAVYNYMVSLLSPKKWELFHLNALTFHSLQDELSINWKKILGHLNIADKDIESSITLLPSSIIVSEALFSKKIEEINLLRSINPIDLNTVLQRLCSMDLFDICEKIATKWEMSPNIAQILQASSGVKPAESEQTNLLGKWMHLLLFFTLSKPAFIDAGLNDFIDFQIDYVGDIYEEFSTLMEIS